MEKLKKFRFLLVANVLWLVFVVVPVANIWPDVWLISALPVLATIIFWFIRAMYLAWKA